MDNSNNQPNTQNLNNGNLGVPPVNNANNPGPAPISLEQNMNSTSLESMNLSGNNSQIETLDVLETNQNPNLENSTSTTNNDNNSTNNVDNFNAVPTPPVFEDDSKNKKKKVSPLIIILLFVIILGIGGALYYFLVLAKNNAPTTGTLTIIPKEVHINLKEEIPSDISVYADITGTDISTCTLNNSAINNEVVSAYDYSVTCGNRTELGKAIVEDVTAPEVVLNDLEVLIGNTPKVEDFIDYCIDASTCSYELITDLTNIITLEGEHMISIKVTDAYGNENTVEAKLIIGNTTASSYMVCTSPIKNIDEIYATEVDTYKIGINNTNGYYNATKIVNLQFENADDYTSQAEGYNPSMGINNIIGTTYFDKINKTILIKKTTSLEELTTELGANLQSDDINILRAFMIFQGYTCE